jgi:5'-nucleotidase
VCALGLAAWTWPALGRHGQVTISVVGTTDLHGRIAAEDGRGGLELLGGYLDNLRAVRAADGGAVVLLDTGDTFQGGITSNLSEGAVVIDAYNALGYTALAVGTHDFEYGAVDTWDDPPAGVPDLRGALKARAAQARFPFLAANLIDSGTGRPVDWPNVRPSVVVDAAGIRVGIVGVMTFDALSMTLAANVHGLSIAPLAAAIAREATALRTSGAQLVIVAAHAGGVCESFDDPADANACYPATEMFEVAGRLPRGLVDVIVAGHTHSAVAHLAHGIPMVQALYWGQAFSRVDVTMDTRTGTVVGTRIFPPHEVCARHALEASRCVPASTTPSVEARYEGRAVVASRAVGAAMAPALQRVAEVRARPLGITLDAEVPRGAGDVESPLGNLFADAMRDLVPGTDVALGYSAGPGGLRVGLPAGPLTQGSVYDAFPFDNRVVRLTVTGDQLGQMLTNQVRRPRFRSRSLGVSGLQVTMDCRSDELRVEVRHDSGTPIGASERLVVATTDFMASRLTSAGGDPEAGRPRLAPGTYHDAPLVRDVVARWLRAQGDRLQAARFADPSRPRWLRTEAAATGCQTRPR